MRTRILPLAVLLLAFFSATALAQPGGAKPPLGAQPKKEKDDGLKPPPAAPGLRITLRSVAKTPTKIVATFRNMTNQTITIKNEFPGAIQRNSSFVRVFLDGRQVAASGIYNKKLLVRNASVVHIKPTEETPILEFDFFNLGTGDHTLYVAYSSQVFNYEKNQHNWWLGTTESNTLNMRVRRADMEKQIVNAGNSIMDQILKDFTALGKRSSAMTGVGAGSLKRGKGAYSGINQIVYQTKPVSIVVQVRGIEEKLDPVPQFERKFPTLGVTVVCYFYGNDPALRNAVFEAVRERAQAYNRLTKEMAMQTQTEISQVSRDTLSLIREADVIVKAHIKAAEPELQDNMQTLFVLTAKSVRVFKGKPRQEPITIYTDSPNVRFSGPFVNRQFILYLDLKYTDPETYNLLGAEAVSPQTEQLIKQTLEKKQ
jgi:hypothetical protein